MKYRRHEDRETLERIKRWPGLARRFPMVRIYSAEHDAFWRGTGNGYTSIADDSDVWPIAMAVLKTGHCGPEKRIQFIPARVAQSAPRQIVQISAIADVRQQGTCLALCDDGTVWETDGSVWREMPPIPQDTRED